MADATPIEPERLYPTPLTPLWPRRWLGFPPATAPLIGREHEVALLSALLREPWRRLVTVTGPGGVGKTRLALAVATEVGDAFADGGAFVPLAAVGDPALLLPTIARVLEVREAPDRPLHETLIGVLRDRRLLLVLDNVEHLAGAAAAADVAALLAGCAGLTVLATSRTPLRLHDEQQFATPTLALPPADAAPELDPDAQAAYGAVALFVARARMADHRFALTAQNSAAVAEICRRLDGLPLAIELAAAWVNVLPPPLLVAKLEPRLPLLRGGGEDQPARLRTMRDAIAWSHDLLTPDEARLFRRLAVFVGGFTLEAAESVEGVAPPSGARSDGPPVLELLTGLVDKSLLQMAEADGAEPRFTMLETVREFALERLVESSETEAVAAAHAAYVRDLAERLEPLLLGPDERRWQARCDAELGNLRAALAWTLEHDVETALRIAAPLWVYWSVHHLAEGRRWLQAALARAAPVQDTIRARALTTEAALASLLGDFAASEAAAVAAVALLAGAGDPIAEARARWVVASAYLSTGQPDGGLRELDRSLTLFAQATTPCARAHAAYAQLTRGAAALMLGDAEQGVGFYEQALAQVRESGSAGVTIVILSDFAGWLVTLGDTSRARGMLEEALTLAAADSDAFLVAVALAGLSLVHAKEGAAENAARCLGAMESMRIRCGLIFPAHHQVRLERATALAKDVLGERAYVRIRNAGREDPDGVVAAALGGAQTREATGATADGPDLSEREREVLALLVAGRSDRDIARALFISPRTASNHVGSIRRKLKVSTRAEAAVRAVRDGLVEPSPEP